MIQPTIDPEARALAQCYALLIRKARERRERLAAQADVKLCAGEGKPISMKSFQIQSNEETAVSATDLID